MVSKFAKLNRVPPPTTNGPRACLSKQGAVTAANHVGTIKAAAVASSTPK
jgi:hypothetical protein